MHNASMIVVHGAIRLRADEIENVTGLAREFVAIVHQERGCLAYDLSWDVSDPATLRLIEQWESEPDYQEHRTQPHVRRWAETIASVQESPVVTVKLRASEL